ncbi:SLIT and NTRK-like protein 1 [Anoplophora glabripennis]|uniref:SLIT and NTRK-like protein 1 n=1 Tax=Anoplophora glabripennis TaxID=217634 RepID=UPI000874B083|nr:SLIT and NTRK-like protein 1 [Anoplophora glabripennis]
MLQGLENVITLNLAMNSISFIESDSFKQTPNLKYLVLSHNQLREINGNIFSNAATSNLKKLYINDNKLMFLPFNFFVRLRKFKNIVIAGNPWYCSCLTIVEMQPAENGIVEKCNEKYSSGERAVCISGSVGESNCVHLYNDDVSGRYETYKRTLPLPKKPVTCTF